MRGKIKLPLIYVQQGGRCSFSSKVWDKVYFVNQTFPGLLKLQSLKLCFCSSNLFFPQPYVGCQNLNCHSHILYTILLQVSNLGQMSQLKAYVSHQCHMHHYMYGYKPIQCPLKVSYQNLPNLSHLICTINVKTFKLHAHTAGET